MPVLFAVILILPLIGSLTTPFVLLYVTVSWFRDIGDPALFYVLGTPVQVAMLLEFVIVHGMLALAPLALWTLFAHDRRYPYVKVTLLVLSCVVAILNSIALGLMGDAVRKEYEASLPQTMFSMFSSAIWIAYLMTSQRVRATFTGGIGEEYRSDRVPRVLGETAT